MQSNNYIACVNILVTLKYLKVLFYMVLIYWTYQRHFMSYAKHAQNYAINSQSHTHMMYITFS